MISNICTIAQRSALFASLIKLASFLKVSYVIGPFALFFSATHIIMPLTGAFGGVSITLLTLGIGFVSKLLLGASYAPYIITYHIPELFASAYWTYRHWLLHGALPIGCMLLFITHPEGFYAAPYALYWLIPVVLYVKKSTSVFATALGSTFIAHAVGSVIWLYTVPMTTAAWYMLIPVVAVERLLFAVGMTMVHKALTYVFARTYGRTLHYLKTRLLYHV
jgi:hypothetical protein